MRCASCAYAVWSQSASDLIRVADKTSMNWMICSTLTVKNSIGCLVLGDLKCIEIEEVGPQLGCQEHDMRIIVDTDDYKDSSHRDRSPGQVTGGGKWIFYVNSDSEGD